ncbi:unnamed protein product [Cunninghamella echinulata]
MERNEGSSFRFFFVPFCWKAWSYVPIHCDPVDVWLKPDPQELRFANALATFSLASYILELYSEIA